MGDESYYRRCSFCGSFETNRHHLKPRSHGGTGNTQRFCRPCHTAVHAFISNAELATTYNTVEKLCGHPVIAKWIEWRKQHMNDHHDRNMLRWFKRETGIVPNRTDMNRTKPRYAGETMEQRWCIHEEKVKEQRFQKWTRICEKSVTGIDAQRWKESPQRFFPVRTGEGIKLVQHRVTSSDEAPSG